MRRGALIVAILLAACAPELDSGADEDIYLAHVVAAYGLRPLPTKPFTETAKFRLGQALFFDPLLAGNRDISCATCHLIGRGLSDELSASIGSGGTGLGEARRLPPGRPVQPRNAPDLWNRDNNSVTAMFWDGRAEARDPLPHGFHTPLGDRLPDGFENLMAAQAIFPLTQADEMLGLPGDAAPDTLPPSHAGRPNELAAAADGLVEPERTLAVLRLLARRLVGEAGEPAAPWQESYRELFRAAYPGLPVEDVSIVEIGNALAHFEEIAFATRDAPWDKYLAGDKAAIGAHAKRGALLFFGKAGCAVCHSGPLFSDFGFHGVGVPASGPGYDDSGTDAGRHRATARPEDRYKFRTSPLRNVTLTAPYFHNGSVATLEKAIRQHLDPLAHADRYNESGGMMMTPAVIDAVSPILTIRRPFDDAEIAALIAFLHALEDPASAYVARIIPEVVPSGLPVAAVAR
jgi:cytochrome c peroxidase